jgi:low affinity Fe/Cu permease
MRDLPWYSRFAKAAAQYSGRPKVFVFTVAFIIGWGLAGPIFDFSEGWQLVINTGTTIFTVLLVLLIQNTQNRDTEAIHLKLDELIRTSQGAHNALLDLEELDSETLDKFRAKYQALARNARSQVKRGAKDTGTPHLSTERYCKDGRL